MANLAITISVLIGGLILLGFVGLAWAFWMRQRYGKEVKGKIKAIFTSEGASEPDELILPLKPGGTEVDAPRGHQIGTYYVNRGAMRNTPYPAKPFLGLWFVQVPISTQWWAVGNPEPITGHRIPPVATSEQIFQSNDTNYMFALRQAKAEIDAQRMELAKSLKDRVKASYVYIGLGAIILGILVVGYLVYNDHNTIQKLAQTIGVAAK